MRSRYWLRCFALYRRTTIYYTSREARDGAVAELTGHGYGCVYNN